MKKCILFITILSLLILSCKEPPFTGDEFQWSLDGKKLAVINRITGELLLVKHEENKIKEVTLIDKYEDVDKDIGRICKPEWSYNSEYLCYSKYYDDHLELFVYSFADDSKKLLSRIVKKGKDTNLDNLYELNLFPYWTPNENKIIYSNIISNERFAIFSINADGKGKKRLINKYISSNPQFSPDGKWIIYSLHGLESMRDNGLWKIRSDGGVNKKLIKIGEMISHARWSSNGQRIAYVRNNDVVEIIDANGLNKNKIYHNAGSEITNLDWSPDDKYLTIVEENGTISLFNSKTNRIFKFPYDNLIIKYWGWGESDELFFSIDYPDPIYTENEWEKEIREFNQTTFEDFKMNCLIKFKNFQFIHLQDNIITFQYSPVNKCSIFTKAYQNDKFSGILFYPPELIFANGSNEYIIRKKEEYSEIATVFYVNQEYSKAFNSLDEYWENNLNSNDFKSYFQSSVLIKRMADKSDESDANSIHARELITELLKTILTLREVNQADKAHWLLDQLKEIYRYGINEPEKNTFQDYFLPFLNVYGRFRKFDDAFQDIDYIVIEAKENSNIMAYKSLIKSILKYQTGQNEQGMTFLLASCKSIIDQPNDLDELYSYLLICHIYYYIDPEDSEIMNQVKKLTQISVFDDEDRSEVYTFLADLYQRGGKTDEAYSAFQHAVALKFDKYETWQKLFDVKEISIQKDR